MSGHGGGRELDRQDVIGAVSVERASIPWISYALAREGSRAPGLCDSCPDSAASQVSLKSSQRIRMAISKAGSTVARCSGLPGIGTTLATSAPSTEPSKSRHVACPGAKTATPNESF